MVDAPKRPDARTAVVPFMRWSANCGVETFDRQVTWVRETRAKTILFKDGKAVRDSSAYADQGAFLQSLRHAVDAASETSQRQGAHPAGAMREFSIAVSAEAFDVPYLSEGGTLLPVPGDWYVRDDASLAAWLIACDQGEEVTEPAKGIGRPVAAQAVVWRSDRPDQNAMTVAKFERMASKPVRKHDLALVAGATQSAEAMPALSMLM